MVGLFGGPAHASQIPLGRGEGNVAAEKPDRTEKFTAWTNGVQYVPAGEPSGNLTPTPLATWAACGAYDGEEKLVRLFWRSGWAGVVTSGYGYLRCGPTTNTWGYRHINQNHSSQWQTIASMVGSDWRSFCDWATEQVLKNPDSAIFREHNSTFVYRAPIYIVNSQNQVVASYSPVVVIGLGNERVITSYPAQ